MSVRSRARLRPMDDSERLADQYLRSLGLGKVDFEPDGNVPPDFCVDARIAVEVRRLNQSITSPEGDTRGLEEVSIPLWKNITRLLPTLGPSVAGESWLVSLDFQRPLESWKSLECKVRRELSSFMTGPQRQPTTIIVSKNLSLDIFHAGSGHEDFFAFAGSCDDDSGGWLLHEFEKNLRFCIAEKERKIAPHRSKYDEWWLVLADHVGLGLDDEDRREVRERSASIEHSWAKIIILDLRDRRRAFEIQ